MTANVENVPPPNSESTLKRKRTSAEGVSYEPASLPSPSKRARSGEVTASSWLRALPAWASGARRRIWATITAAHARDVKDVADGLGAHAVPNGCSEVDHALSFGCGGQQQAVPPHEAGDRRVQQKPAEQLRTQNANRAIGIAKQSPERVCYEQQSEPQGLSGVLPESTLHHAQQDVSSGPLDEEHSFDSVDRVDIARPQTHAPESHPSASKLEGAPIDNEARPDLPAIALFNGNTGKDHPPHQEAQKIQSRLEGMNRRTAKLHRRSLVASPAMSSPEQTEVAVPQRQAAGIRVPELPVFLQSEIAEPQHQAAEIRASELASPSQLEVAGPQHQVAEMKTPDVPALVGTQHPKLVPCTLQMEASLSQHQAAEAKGSVPPAQVSGHHPSLVPDTSPRRGLTRMTCLKIEPSDVLRFSKMSGGKVGAVSSFRLVSTASGHVAVKIKTTAPERYDVRPCFATLKPGDRMDVHVTVRGSNLGNRTKDKFLVQAVDVGAVVSVNRDQWTQFAKTDVQQHRLRVADVTL